MENKKPSTVRRVIAYIIDLMIITILSGILTVVLVDNTKYEASEKEIMDLVQQFSKGEIEREDYIKQYDELNYEMTVNNLEVTMITCGMSILYFVVLCYFCNGITLGKYMLKMQIVSNNGKKLTILNYFLRSLIMNMVLSNIVTVVLIKVLPKVQFIKINTYAQNIFSIAIVLSFLFIMYRNDGRGIEDFMGNTKVIDLKRYHNENDKTEKDDVEEEKDDQSGKKDKKIKDAVIVKEKKK